MKTLKTIGNYILWGAMIGLMLSLFANASLYNQREQYEALNRLYYTNGWLTGYSHRADSLTYRQAARQLKRDSTNRFKTK